MSVIVIFLSQTPSSDVVGGSVRNFWHNVYQFHHSRHLPALRLYDNTMANQQEPVLGNMAVDDNTMPHQYHDLNASDDLAAIRALLLAILRHLSIEIPREIIPLRISTGDADPKNSRYKEDQTIDYLIRQTPVRLAMRLQQMRNTTPFALNTTSPETRQGIDAGVSSMLSWSIDIRELLQSGNVDYQAFSYDENGHVSGAFGGDVRHSSSTSMPSLDIKEHIVSVSPDGLQRW